MNHELPLDHIILAVPDVNSAAAEFERSSGVTPVAGGRVPSAGTYNYFVSIGDDCTFEILGPDPSQTRQNNFGAALARLPGPKVFAYCLRAEDIDEVFRRMSARGLSATTPTGAPAPGPNSMSRETPQGEMVRWRLLVFGSHPFGLAIPGVIQRDTPMLPSQAIPRGCSLADFHIEHPDPEGLSALTAEIGFKVRTAPTSGNPVLHVELNTPKGSVRF